MLLSALPKVAGEDEDQDYTDHINHFLTKTLPPILGVAIASGVVASIFKDSFMKAMKCFCSSQIVGTVENHIKFWSTVPVINWGNEFYRWMYFTMLQGEAEVGDIPFGNILEEDEFSRITLFGKLPSWKTVYEFTTAHPYCIELRHARIKGIKPYFIQAFVRIDEILKGKALWTRQEMRQDKNLVQCCGDRAIFRGLSYESNLCILYLKNATSQIENVSFSEISEENRSNALEEFVQPFQVQNIELVPIDVFSILKGLIIIDEDDEEHKILINQTEDKNNLYIEHPKGLTIQLYKKNHFLS